MKFSPASRDRMKKVLEKYVLKIGNGDRKALLNDINVTMNTGIKYSTFNDWCNGKTFPNGDNLSTLADYFNVSTDYILGRTTAKRPLSEEPKEIVCHDLKISGEVYDMLKLKYEINERYNFNNVIILNAFLSAFLSKKELEYDIIESLSKYFYAKTRYEAFKHYFENNEEDSKRGDMISYYNILKDNVFAAEYVLQKELMKSAFYAFQYFKSNPDFNSLFADTEKKISIHNKKMKEKLSDLKMKYTKKREEINENGEN